MVNNASAWHWSDERGSLTERPNYAAPGKKAPPEPGTANRIHPTAVFPIKRSAEVWSVSSIVDADYRARDDAGSWNAWSSHQSLVLNQHKVQVIQ